jgi:hypothetical protein
VPLQPVAPGAVVPERQERHALAQRSAGIKGKPIVIPGTLIYQRPGYEPGGRRAAWQGAEGFAVAYRGVRCELHWRTAFMRRSVRSFEK